MACGDWVRFTSPRWASIRLECGSHPEVCAGDSARDEDGLHRVGRVWLFVPCVDLQHELELIAGSTHHRAAGHDEESDADDADVQRVGSLVALKKISGAGTEEQSSEKCCGAEEEEERVDEDGQKSP